MADLSITAANVALVTDPKVGIPTQVISGVAGTAVLAGQAVYQDISGRFQLTLSTDSLKSLVVGIATCSAPGANQPLTVAIRGDLTIGATLTVANPALLGSAPGGITITAGDYTTGWYPGSLGVCVTASNIRIAVATNNGVHV